MNTPRKNFNYNSPYAKPVQQYASQSEDYISLDMGGPVQQQNAACLSKEKTPHCSNMKYYQENNRNSNSKANRRNLFNNSYSQPNSRQSFKQQQRYRPRYSNEYPQQQNITDSHEKRQQHRSDKKDNNIASYCHPSMTENPWSELIKRLKALEKSKISSEKSSPQLASNASSDNDQQEDSAASD